MDCVLKDNTQLITKLISVTAVLSSIVHRTCVYVLTRVMNISSLWVELLKQGGTEMAVKDDRCHSDSIEKEATYQDARCSSRTIWAQGPLCQSDTSNILHQGRPNQNLLRGNCRNSRTLCRLFFG